MKGRLKVVKKRICLAPSHQDTVVHAGFHVAVKLAGNTCIAADNNRKVRMPLCNISLLSQLQLYVSFRSFKVALACLPIQATPLVFRHLEIHEKMLFSFVPSLQFRNTVRLLTDITEQIARAFILDMILSYSNCTT